MRRKNFTLVTFAFYLFGCTATPTIVEPPPEPGILIIKYLLQDSLGFVSFSIPKRYDTSVRWIHKSDCGKPCNEVKYRFQPSYLPIFKESGFYYYPLKDSVEQFTITHSEYYPFLRGDSSFIFSAHNHIRDRIREDPFSGKLILDTIQKINNRYFSVVAAEGFNSDVSSYSIKVVATTTIKGNEIKFEYFIVAKNQNTNKQQFISRSLYWLKTINVEKDY